MTNREALEVVKSMKIFLGGRMNGKSQLASTYNEALIRIFDMAENSEKIRAYCKENLSKCDELREKCLKSDREYDRAQAKVFECMAEAYADIIERCFKEADNETDN